MNQLLNHISLFLAISCFLILSACQEDNTFESLAEEPAEITQNISYPNVDSRLWPYFQRFEEEGKARGLNVNLIQAAISGSISDLEGEHVAGQCTFSSQQPNHVTVDEEFWEKSGDRFIEFIVFHELGHCYLGRGHREDAYANGTCISLMRSGVEDCRDNYTGNSRTTYVDELFKPENF